MQAYKLLLQKENFRALSRYVLYPLRQTQKCALIHTAKKKKSGTGNLKNFFGLFAQQNFELKNTKENNNKQNKAFSLLEQLRVNTIVV